jgi:hypothetical protein
MSEREAEGVAGRLRFVHSHPLPLLPLLSSFLFSAAFLVMAP